MVLLYQDDWSLEVILRTVCMKLLTTVESPERTKQLINEDDFILVLKLVERVK